MLLRLVIFLFLSNICNANRLLSKLASDREFEGGSEHRNAVYMGTYMSIKGTEPTYKLTTEVEFRKKSNEHKIIVEYITKQFKGKSVSQTEIEKIWQNIKVRDTLYIARFQIVNQQLYADADSVHRLYFRYLLEYLNKFLKTHKVKDVDFIVYGRDEIPPDYLPEEIFAVPSFMMSKNLANPYERSRFLMPDSYMLTNDWQNLATSIIKAREKHPWSQKINKLFWRGAATGSNARYAYDTKNISQLARLKLVFLSKLYPNQIDARFTSNNNPINNQDSRNLKTILNLLFGEDYNFVKETDHLKYKYLLAIDGNTCPWQRVPWIMLSNSLLVKQETQKIEWFYPAIKPYIHYIPLKEDLTDIFTKLEWVENHNEETQQIVKNAQNFIANNLMPEHIDSYMAIILEEYSKIQKDKNIVPTLPKAEDASSLTSLLKTLIHQIKRKYTD